MGRGQPFATKQRARSPGREPVRATLRLDRRASYVDYLAAEQDSPTRHEYIDGVIVAMAGGSDEHKCAESP
jgi:Uma2 family endonuclease